MTTANSSNLAHSEVVRPRIARLLGKSLGWVEGEGEHKRMRQLVGTSLSPDAIKQGAPNVFAAAERVSQFIIAIRLPLTQYQARIKS